MVQANTFLSCLFPGSYYCEVVLLIFCICTNLNLILYFYQLFSVDRYRQGRSSECKGHDKGDLVCLSVVTVQL